MAETFLALKPFAIAALGGIVPALVWLWFWLREDRATPEPRGLVALSFAAGMAVVFFVLPLQQLVVSTLSFTTDIARVLAEQFSLVAPSSDQVQTFLWAATEEIAKFATVALIALHSRHFDEPIDAVIYLITAAIGFTAMENTLYLLKDLSHDGGAVLALLNGNLRFIGATILHIASSAIVGLTLAFTFYGPRFLKIAAVTIGLLIATLLHAYFNLSIMETHGVWKTLILFSGYWGAIVGIIVLIQVVKRIKKPTPTL